MTSGHLCNGLEASWVPVRMHTNECLTCEGEMQITPTVGCRGQCGQCGQSCGDRGKLERRQQNQPPPPMGPTQRDYSRLFFELTIIMAENAHKASHLGFHGHGVKILI